jgi:small conductance mechanosensitive channel
MKHILATLILAGYASVALAACSSGPQSTQNPQQLGQTTALPIDQQLTTRIQDALKGLFSKYSNVNVSVNNGMVTLKGTVSSQSDKDNLEQIVNKIPGVSGVNNQITVQSGAEQSSQAKPSF